METNYKNVLLDFSFLDNLKGIDPRLASDGGKTRAPARIGLANELTHLKTIAIGAFCFMAAVVRADLVDFSDRLALELPRETNISSGIDGNLADTGAFAGTFAAMSAAPAALFEDLRTQPESCIFLQNKIEVIRIEAISNLPRPGATNAAVPEPSSLITALISGCGVLFGLQRLRRRKF